MTDAASPRSARTLSTPPSDAASRNPSARAKYLEAHRVAQDLFDLKPDWVVFFREIVGVGGAIARLFPTHEERTAFEQSSEYADIQRMLAELRSQAMLRVDMDDKEPTRVITVRLPKSMHEALRAEAYSRQISMNKLCIAKLVKVLDAGVDADALREEEP